MGDTINVRIDEDGLWRVSEEDYNEILKTFEPAGWINIELRHAFKVEDK